MMKKICLTFRLSPLQATRASICNLPSSGQAFSFSERRENVPQSAFLNTAPTELGKGPWSPGEKYASLQHESKRLNHM